MSDKKKIVIISDHPLVPSGVGTQAKYLIEGLLETGKYRFLCLGGAIQHPNYTPQKVAPEKYGDDWIIIPVNGYGDKDTIRRLLYMERPDALVIFTDPRFFVWLWEIEDEVRSVCPLLYWHVWDNDPTPKYNLPFYESTDYIVALSLKTLGLLQDNEYDKSRFSYIPHTLPADLFKPLPEEIITKYKHDNYGPHKDKKFVVFWNNRNARRKQTGDVLATFAKFADVVGRDNVALMMHTNVGDPEGQDILAVADRYGIDKELIISENRVTPEELNSFYNVADCTINIASNEGFGLGTLESLFAGTPIVVHMTGGLQFQIGDWWQTDASEPWKASVDLRNQDAVTDFSRKMWRKHRGGSGTKKWWGVPIFPASRSCTGSQQIPYIYDDRVNHDEVVQGLVHLYEMGRTKRRQLGLEARAWALRTFKQDDMWAAWDRVLGEQIDKHRARGGQSLHLASL